jgi:CBS domain-containing protein
MTKDLSQYTVSPTDSIRTAMLKITANKHRAVVVLDGRRVVGTVSDGDIRRAFLKDVLPMAPVSHIMNVNCRMTTDTDPEALERIVVREKVTLLPIVSSENELIDVYLATAPN